MLLEMKAPEPYMDYSYCTKVFMGGSIEMGAARDWQAELVGMMKKFFDKFYDVLLLNPRPDDFDASQEQSVENPYFLNHVIWELKALQDADHIFFHFEPDTMSPITLMELGLMAESKKVIVSCPPGYWRKGNVDILCSRYRIPQFDSLEEAGKTLIHRILTRG